MDKRKKILIIEDNELNLKLFNDILKSQNYNVDCAEDGLEGYKKIKKNKYDLIILDIQLPKLNGFELLEKLNKEKIKLCEVVVISAFAMDCDKEKAKKYNIDSYITKPIDIKNFLQTVKSKLQP